MSDRSEELKVSIIIVSWNAREHLLKCLASLTSEACCYSMEIIVVDNASTDGSVESVRNGFPNVRVVAKEQNLGFAKGNNVGILASTGQYLCLINSDVEVLPGCITRLVDYCEACPEVGMVGPRVRGSDGNLQRSCRGFPTVWNMFCRALALDSIFPRSRLFAGYSLSHWAQDSIREVDILSGCFWLVRRQSLDRAGLLDESYFMYGEDMDWCKSFWRQGWKVVFVPQAEAIHYGGGSSANAPVRFYIERHRAELQYWRKHHCALGASCFYLISCLHLLLRVLGYSLASLLNRPARAACRYKVKRSLACLRWLVAGAPAKAAS